MLVVYPVIAKFTGQARQLQFHLPKLRHRDEVVMLTLLGFTHWRCQA